MNEDSYRLFKAIILTVLTLAVLFFGFYHFMNENRLDKDCYRWRYYNKSLDRTPYRPR